MWELLDRVIDNRLVLAGPIRTAQALAEQVVMPNFWVIGGVASGVSRWGFYCRLSSGSCWR